MIQLGKHFKSVNGRRRSDWERLQRQYARKRIQHEHRELQEDQAEEDLAAFAVSAIVATQIQIEQFEAKLDTYSEATVVALMKNQEQLDALRDQIALLLDRAYVMEDGRRVFRTADGTQVFDEFGKEVSPDVLDPSAISDEHPSWEAYSTLRGEETALETKRTEILEFQEKVDAARERVADGEISKSDLDKLDADLMDAMPPTVRSHVSGMEAQEPAPNLTSEFAKPSALPHEGASHSTGANLNL